MPQNVSTPVYPPKHNRETRPLSVYAGLAAPVLLVTLVAVLSQLESGYSNATQMMSVLGGVPGIRGFMFNTGLAITGALVIIFAQGLHKGIDHGAGSILGPFLLGIGGVGLIGAAIFHCNEGCANAIGNITPTGYLHYVSAFLAGMGLAFAPLLFYFRMRYVQGWEGSANISLLVTILGNLAGILFWINLRTHWTTEWAGLLQRAGVIFSLIWIELMAYKMLRISKRQIAV